jgi:hypothetical protein
MLSLMVSVQVCSCMEDVRCEIAVVALCCCWFVVVLCVWLYTCMAVVQTREGQRSKSEAWLICECNIDGRTWSLWVLSLDVSVFSCVCTRKDGCCSSSCCVQERVRRVCAFVCCLLLLGQVWSTRFVCVCRLGFAWWAGPVCEVRWHVVAHMSCIMSMCVPLLCVLLDLMEHVTKKLDVRVDECFWRLSYERRLIGYNPRQECVCVLMCCVVVDVLLQGCFGCVEDCVGMFFDGKRVLLLSLVRQTLSWNTSFFVWKNGHRTDGGVFVDSIYYGQESHVCCVLLIRRCVL